MTNPEEVSRMMYEALSNYALFCGNTCASITRETAGELYVAARAAIRLYEQSITVDLERQEYERGEVESAQSVAFNKGESR